MVHSADSRVLAKSTATYERILRALQEDPHSLHLDIFLRNLVEACLSSDLDSKQLVEWNIKGKGHSSILLLVEGLHSFNDDDKERMEKHLAAKVKELYGVDVALAITDVTEEGHKFSFQEPFTAEELQLLDRLLGNYARLRLELVPTQLLRCYWIVAPLAVAYLLVAHGKNLSHCPRGPSSLPSSTT